jgi:radical SAM superfamily enzyme YgiQ (UPF0313 family)
MTRAEIVLTSDLSLTSDYNSLPYLGFGASLPENICPHWVYFKFFCPLEPAYPDGTIVRSTLGLRTIEATCIQSGFNREQVAVAHSLHLDKMINKNTKIVGISAEDPLGIGPATSTWSTIFNGIPHNRIEYFRLMRKVKELKKKHDFQVVMGGPGAWEVKNHMDTFGIDYLVIGEGEYVIKDLFSAIIEDNGSPDENVFYGKPVKPEDVPLIQGPALGAYTEISRGCGRGCKFCAPNTAGKMRNFPLDKILNDAKLNAEGNKDNSICLQSEDVFLYGSNSKNFYPDEDAIMNLYKTLFEDVGVSRVFVTHSTLAPMAYNPDFFARLTKYLRSKGHRFYGCQPGIETGCKKTIGDIMHGKALPFSTDEYPDMIYDALRVCAELGWMNVCTLMTGLPSEGPDEMKETLELIQRIDEFPHLYIPLFFVPMKVSNMADSRAFIADNMNIYHKRIVLDCWKHNLKYIDRNFNVAVTESRHKYMVKAGIRAMIEILRTWIRYYERRHKIDEIELTH